MRFPVRVFFRLLSSFLIFVFLLPTFVSVAHAQTTPPSAYQFISPNVNPDVPHNQHTFIQSLFLESLLAIQCQLTGIDLSDPTKSCLGFDMKTGRLGYAPSDPSQQGGTHIGGLLGIATQGVSMMYTPTFGSHDYFQYLSDNFGIVKQTHAAAYTGFQGLQPVLGLWKTTRDISYYLLIIAFIFIGIGVMLRLKIDPRTVMTIQNQIPRVIICIILITFSYAFAGLLVDTMWAVTYMGINKITESANPAVLDNGDQLNKVATRYLLSNPYSFVNFIFQSPGAGGGSGIVSLGWQVGQSIGTIEKDTIIQLFFGATASDSKCFGFGGSVSGCLQNAVSWVLGFLWFFIVAIAILITLFRIWLELIKAYIMVLLYVILAPIWIVFGLLPKRPLGFEKWLRVFFANLAVFPAVVFILVGARVLHELFSSHTVAQYRFVPPLIGNPDTNAFGSILEFAMVLMAPQLLSIIREKLGATPLKQAGAAFQTFTAARGAVGAPTKQAIKHWNKRDQQGFAIGPLARTTDRVTGGLAKAAGKIGLRSIERQHEASEAEKREYGGGRKYVMQQDAYNDARKAAKKAGTLKDFDEKFKKKESEGGYGGSIESWAKDPTNHEYTKNIPGTYHPYLNPDGEKSDKGKTDETKTTSTTPVGATSPAQVAAPTVTQPTATAAQPVGRPEFTVRFVKPDGSDEKITINPTEQRTMREIVLEGLPDSDAKTNLTQHITQTINPQDPTSHWNMTPTQIRNTQGAEESLQRDIDTHHINPTVNPAPENGTI